jgi:hypothetical protein
MEANKRIALVAHDAKKDELIHWVKCNSQALASHVFWSTGTTGKRILDACPNMKLTPLKSGPLGGDQQIGAKIAEGPDRRPDLLHRCHVLAPPRCRRAGADPAFDALQCRNGDEPDDCRLPDRLAAVRATLRSTHGRRRRQAGHLM